MPLNIHMQWNAGTACVSECVLKMLACRGLRVGPSKFSARDLNDHNRVDKGVKALEPILNFLSTSGPNGPNYSCSRPGFLQLIQVEVSRAALQHETHPEKWLVQ